MVRTNPPYHAHPSFTSGNESHFVRLPVTKTLLLDGGRGMMRNGGSLTEVHFSEIKQQIKESPTKNRPRKVVRFLLATYQKVFHWLY